MPYQVLHKMALREGQFASGPVLQLETGHKSHHLGVVVTTSAWPDVDANVVDPEVTHRIHCNVYIC